MKKHALLFFSFIIGISCVSLSQQSKIDSLSIAMGSSRGESNVEILLQLANLYLYSNTDSSLWYSKQANELAIRLKDKNAEIKSNFNLAEVYFNLGDIKNVYGLIHRGIQLSEELSDSYLLCRGKLLSGKYYSYLGDHKKALTLVQQALSLAVENNDQRMIIVGYNALGIIYERMAKYDLASEYYFKGLKAAEEAGEKRSMQNALFNISNLLILNKKYEDSHEYLKKFLGLSIQLEDKTGIRDYYHEMGVLHQKQKELKTALAMFDSAIFIADQLKDTLGIAILLGNSASAMREMGQVQESLKKLLKAADLRVSIHSDPSHTYNDIAESLLALKKWKEAHAYAEKAVLAAGAYSNKNQMAEAMYILSQCHLGAGEYQQAYLELEKYYAVKDSLFSLRKDEQIETIKIQYETEKKEEQIELLDHKNKIGKLKRNALALLTFLLLVIGGLLINRQRLKTREQKRLYEKSKEVERTKSRFFANITHELRTPLTLILGPIEILKSGIKSRENIHQLNILDNNANRLLDLINQLLDLSKIDAGKLKLQTEPCNLLNLINRVSALFESVFQIKNIEFSIQSDLKHQVLQIDVDKMEKVFVNLLSNALKFTPKGGRVEVNLGINNKDSKNQFITISFRDTGKGIPTNEIANIFDPYFQSSDTLNGEYTGTGIGLALTKEIVELHGGTITVKSKEGEGTEFIINLSTKLINSAPDIIEVNTYPEKLAPAGFMKNDTEEFIVETESVNSANILIVEDNKEVSDYILSILNPIYKTDRAKDGSEGLEKAQKNIPDLVISDVMMPKMNGFEFCEKLKSDEKTSHIPVILLTARDSSEDRIRGLLNQADDYLVKPFIPKELLTRINNLIESRKALRKRFSKEFIFKPGEMEITSLDDQFLEKLNNQVEANLEDEHLGVVDIAEMMNMSRSQLHRKVKALTNLAPNEFIRNYRLIRAKELITKKAGSNAEIAFAVGFNSPSYFTRCFREYFGYPPSEIGKNLTVE